MQEGRKKLITVGVITYNHEPFIAKCLQGILNQVADFDFDIVIGEDASSDNTRNICEAFIEKYPGRIKLLPGAANKGIQANLKDVLEHCRNHYIALCEGDDEWMDTGKLQKQVDFLENNAAYSLCSTRYIIHNSATGEIKDDGLQEIFEGNIEGIEIIPANMFENWLTKTCTVVFRTAAFSTNLIDRYSLFRDTHLCYHILQKGRGYCLNIITSIYNLHNEGVWSTKTASERMLIALKVFAELHKRNPKDQDLKEKYAKQIMQYIDHEIKKTSRPLAKPGLHKAIMQYAFLKRSPGIILLKYRQALLS